MIFRSLTITFLLAACLGLAPSRAAAARLVLHASAFHDRGHIPDRYTCDGADISPALHWTGAPADVRSYALVVFDPDAPDPKAPRMTWVHWIVYNLPGGSTGLARDAGRLAHPGGGDLGTNSWKRHRYGGPCPPIGTHRYFFRLYALDTRLGRLDHPDRKALRTAMRGHILARTDLIGLYRRH